VSGFMGLELCMIIISFSYVTCFRCLGVVFNIRREKGREGGERGKKKEKKGEVNVGGPVGLSIRIQAMIKHSAASLSFWPIALWTL